jgi:hypothetical protein
MNYIYITKVENMPMKIFSLVFYNLLFIIAVFIWVLVDIYSINKANKEGFCIFLNDMRLFSGMSVNPEIWYRDTNFCSVYDPIQVSYENVNGLSRRVSATNIFYTCCIQKGEGCPIFQNYSMMNENELSVFYAGKWFTGY